jgi:hypothetical protein
MSYIGGRIKMKVKEIIFMVEDEPEGGYTASALGHSIYTQADTWDELKKNINGAISCHFDNPEDVPQVIRLHYVQEEMYAYA